MGVSNEVELTVLRINALYVALKWEKIELLGVLCGLREIMEFVTRV